ncbi:MAG: DUF4233 domain-containing protein [Gordonia sp. (in: high G+C Gram-positive bacteria)]|uniref:DUF4233 domain-containing protein n=1 Tax=Gordonia sp. (in: high G+C Gram-positive bacteria) TaxID=84139 RepID=UPI0039E6589B
MTDSQGTEGVPAPAVDPWKGFRGVMAGTLVLEAIVVGLTFPVVATLGSHGITWVSGIYLGVLFVVMILLSGRQGHPRALQIDLILQLFVIAGGLFHWSIAVVGVIFLCVWIYIAYIKRDVQRRIERGALPSQQPPRE